ncbi:MAG: Tat pathway signal protein [Curvibacter sp.]|nr:MAG: Tat pathway signal protein [Curvibacter sp.]
MVHVSRRSFSRSASVLVGGAVLQVACAPQNPELSYDAVADRTWQSPPTTPAAGLDNSLELVRYATLAPSSHNTQCWRYRVGISDIDILPDLERRCPAVDPDDHHLFISLGCATENLVLAAQALGQRAHAVWDAGKEGVHIALEPQDHRESALFHAMTSRQNTRSAYDGQPLSAQELELLARAANADEVQLRLITDRPGIERVLEYTIAANTLQMADVAFTAELKHWIRFNGDDAVASRDGLFSRCTGNPEVPGWLGKAGFRLLFRPGPENDKIAAHIRSSAGIAVFAGARPDKAHWVAVGRSYQRFALQATALGIRSAMVNQAVEVTTVRADFATALGMGVQRPDLVVRFGRGKAMPRSLRRPVSAVVM